MLSTMVSENAQFEGEREELRERVAALEAELAEFRDIEQALLDSVVTGQRAADDVLARLEAMESVAPRPPGAPAEENPLAQPTEIYFSRTSAEAGGPDEPAADR